MDQHHVIASASAGDDLASAVALIRAYAASLDIDLSYQGFAAEMASMPGQYAPPSGQLLLARDGPGTPAGCVALRPLALSGTCEMKRLYVAPSARGSGLGRRLVHAVVAEAICIGYSRIVLDTLPSMTAAMSLYRDCGFRECPPYYANAAPGTRFMQRSLRSRT